MKNEDSLSLQFNKLLHSAQVAANFYNHNNNCTVADQLLSVAVNLFKCHMVWSFFGGHHSRGQGRFEMCYLFGRWTGLDNYRALNANKFLSEPRRNL